MRACGDSLDSDGGTQRHGVASDMASPQGNDNIEAQRCGPLRAKLNAAHELFSSKRHLTREE